MTETNSALSAKPPGRNRWLKRLGLAAGIAAGLLVVLYFVLTSAAFLKSFILPRVSSAIHATVTVDDAALSPFSSVSLTGLKVVTKGGEPVLQAGEVRTGYSLWGMLGGTIKVDEVRIVNAVVQITVNPDGTSNLDPLLSSTTTSAPAKPVASAKPAKAPQLSIGTIALQNATLRYVKLRKDGVRHMSEVANVNVTLDQLRNAQNSKLTIAADLKTETGQTPGAATNDLLRAKFDAALQISLTGELLPKELGLKASVVVGKAQGDFKDLAGLAAALNGDVTPTELKEFALNFTQGGNALGKIHASGPFNLEKREGKVKLEISAIDRQVLNFVGAPQGLDFGNTRIDSTSEISLSQNGRIISATGKLNARQFSVTRDKATTVPLDLTTDYDVTVDKDAQSALLKAFTFSGTQQSRPVLRASLTQPMNVSWSTNANASAVGDAAFDLAVTDLNLADWRAFAGKFVPAGKVNVNLNVQSRQAGQKLAAKLDARVDDLTATFDTNRIENASVNLNTDALLDNLSQVTLNSYQLDLQLKRQAALTVSGKGTYNLKSGDADLQTSLEVMLARALSVAPVPQLDIKNGTLKFDGRVTQKVTTAKKSTNTVQTVTGDLALADLTGQFQQFRFDRFGTALNCDVAKTNSAIRVHTLRGKFNQAANSGGTFDLSASYNLATTNAQATVKLNDVNQHALGSFAAPFLNGGQLASVSISANLAAAYDPKGASSVKGDLQIANLLIHDPKKQLPKVPLSVSLQLEGGLAKDKLDVRQCNGRLALGSEPAGGFDVTGAFDLKKQAGKGIVKVDALNEKGLAPFLLPVLGDKSLASVTINANLNAVYDRSGASAAKGSVEVLNFLINDPQKKLPDVPFSAALTLDGAIVKDALTVRELNGKLTQGTAAAGSFNATANYDLAKKSGQASLKLADLNQNLLRPVLAPSLGDKKLVSGAINATATASFSGGGDSSLKAEVQLANLVVNDPKHQVPDSPLSARLALDGAMQKQVLDMRQLLLALSPTPRAKNELALSGKVDLTDTNATKLNLRLAAESLDVTPFYDLFDNPQKKAGEKRPATAETKPADANTEPPAMKLPLRDSTVDLNIGRLYLREVAASNWVTTVKIDGGKIAVQPLQLTLNGAPINAAANLNLGVPGYQYDLNLTAQGIPLEPFVDSFSPTYRQQAQGKVMADVQVKGAGVTGENLQKNLAGHAVVSLTNANIQIVGSKVKAMLTPIALVLGITEVLKSPLDFVNANIQLGNARINLEDVKVHSAAFLATVNGVIPIEKILTNSPLDLPVQMALTRSVAKKFAFVGKQGDEYVSLPHFATVTGTLGNPTAKTDKTVIAGLLATSVAGNLGGKVGGILGGVGSILTGRAPASPEATTNAPSQSAAQTNKVINLLDSLPLFKKKKK